MSENVETAPVPYGATEIDVAAADFIKSMEAEYKTAEPVDEVLVSDSDSVATPVENSADGTTPAPVTTEPQSNTVEDPTERGLERLVAREVELRTRETALAGKEAEIAALRARLGELESGVLSPELVNKLKHSPTDGLRALGLDPDDVIRLALAEKMESMGKPLDPAIAAKFEQSKTRKEVEALRAQLMESERKAAATAYYNQIASGAQQYVLNSELSKHAPTVAVVAKTAPDRVFAEIMEEITRDAQVRAVREPNANPMSYEDAAKRVEARWSDYSKLLNPNPVASTPQAKTTAPAQPAVNPPPKTNPTVKPPERPLAPWLQTVDIVEDGIKAGIMEYRRSEGVQTKG